MLNVGTWNWTFDRQLSDDLLCRRVHISTGAYEQQVYRDNGPLRKKNSKIIILFLSKTEIMTYGLVWFVRFICYSTLWNS